MEELGRRKKSKFLWNDKRSDINGTSCLLHLSRCVNTQMHNLREPSILWRTCRMATLSVWLPKTRYHRQCIGLSGHSNRKVESNSVCGHQLLLLSHLTLRSSHCQSIRLGDLAGRKPSHLRQTQRHPPGAIMDSLNEVPIITGSKRKGVLP